MRMHYAAYCLRRRTNVKSTLIQRLVSAGESIENCNWGPVSTTELTQKFVLNINTRA